MNLPKGTIISEQMISLSQDNDTNDDGSLGQDIKITALSADDPAEKYIVIETERWAIDPEDIPAFCELLTTMCK